MAWRPRDEASTATIGLLVAAATFGIAFTAANLMVERPAGMDHAAAQLDTRATTALNVIVAQSGSSTTHASWVTDPDLMDRFGLALETEENFLDYRKIKAMRNATMPSASNDAADYYDVRAALGITTGDFHLRTYPVIPNMDDPRWTKDPRGRFAYIAHGDVTEVPPAVDVIASVSVVGDFLNVTLTIENAETMGDFLYAATVGLGTQSTDTTIVDVERQTRLLAPGETQTVWVNFPRMAYTGSPDGVRITVTDSKGRILDIDADGGSMWIPATVPTGSTYTVGVKASAGQRYFLPTEDLTFRLNRYDGAGDIPNEEVNWVFVLVGPDGSEIYNNTVEIKKKKSASYECTACTTPGIYSGFFYNTPKTGFAPTLRDLDVVEVLAAEPVSGPIELSDIAVEEAILIGRLVENFNPTLYDGATNPQGDIFLDATKVRDLPPLLARYTTLIVGSGVEQNSLNSADIKWGIADWVIAGGNLMVLGREDGHANWLQPVYKASIAGAGGGIGAPDPTHPVLTTPNRLDYQRYTDRGLAWGIRSDQPFTHVLTRGVTGGESQDALSVANPGAYNLGSVVLTSYMPGSLTVPHDRDEAVRFLHNMMSQSFNMLFLDYGPTIPDGAPIGSAQRLAAVPHPNVPNAVVEVRIVMYAWD